MNKVTQNEQKDISIRFCNELTNHLVRRYLKLVFLGHAAASDLLDGFKSGLTDVDMDNILQVSMDDPRVNWKSYDILTKDREQSELSGLINIGSCGLHVLQGTFKIGFEVVVLEIKKLLNWLFNLFHDSPARWSGLLIQKNFVGVFLNFGGVFQNGSAVSVKVLEMSRMPLRKKWV